MYNLMGDIHRDSTHLDAINKHCKLVDLRWQGKSTLTSDYCVWVI